MRFIMKRKGADRFSSFTTAYQGLAEMAALYKAFVLI